MSTPSLHAGTRPRSFSRPSRDKGGHDTPWPVMALFCVYVLVWFLQVGYRVPPLGKLRVEFLIGAVLIGMAIMVGRAASAKSLPKVPEVVSSRSVLRGATVLFICIAVQVPLSVDFNLSWTVFFDRVVKFGFMAVFIATFVRSTRDLRWFLFAFLLACAYITQESFRGALTGNMIWENQGVPRLHGDTPLFQHPNSLAGLAAGVLPFAIFLWPVAKKLWQKGFLLVGAGTAAAVVMYSGSRTSYVGIMALLLYVMFASRHRFRLALLLAVLAPVTWVSVPEAYRARFETIFTGKEIEGHSMDARKTILKDAVAVFASHPLGIGVAAFPIVREQMFGRMQDTHNLYLEVATNLGFHGLIAFLVYVTLMMRTLLRIRDQAQWYLDAVERSAQSPDAAPSVTDGSAVEDLRLIHATATAAGGYILLRLVLGLFGMDLYEIYWWIGLGLCIALARLLNRTIAATGLPARPSARSAARRPMNVRRAPRERDAT